MSETMFKTSRIFIVTAVLCGIWVVPGSAFQLFGGEDGLPGATNASLHGSPDEQPARPLETPLHLGSEGVIADQNETMNIWIPGIGVVGKMPKLDFGLEMLYGGQKTVREAPETSQELEEFNSDFAIKGTIKRKF